MLETSNSELNSEMTPETPGLGELVRYLQERISNAIRLTGKLDEAFTALDNLLEGQIIEENKFEPIVWRNPEGKVVTIPEETDRADALVFGRYCVFNGSGLWFPLWEYREHHILTNLKGCSFVTLPPKTKRRVLKALPTFLQFLYEELGRRAVRERKLLKYVTALIAVDPDPDPEGEEEE